MDEDKEGTIFDDDEGFIICLLFMCQAAYRGGRIGSTVQHLSAFLALWEEMGEDGRRGMGDKIAALAEELGYPDRAQELVERRAKQMIDAINDMDDEDLPEPNENYAKA